MQTPFHGPTAVLLITGALALTLAGAAQAQVAGSTAASVTLTEAHEIALGWSAKRSLLGKPVFNDTGDKIGTVQDLIITPDHHLSYVIVGAGGFVGIGRHDVAFPVTQLHEIEGRIVMPGATRDVVRTTPRFDYASDDTRRASFSERANQDIALAKARVADLEKKAVGAETAAKARLDQQVVELHHDIQAAEGKLAEMNRAGASRWKTFEHDVNVALGRLHKALATPAG